MKEIGVKVAEKQMGKLLAEVARGREVTITRYGKPVAVLLSVPLYAKLVDPPGWGPDRVCPEC